MVQRLIDGTKAFRVLWDVRFLLSKPAFCLAPPVFVIAVGTKWLPKKKWHVLAYKTCIAKSWSSGKEFVWLVDKTLDRQAEKLGSLLARSQTGCVAMGESAPCLICSLLRLQVLRGKGLYPAECLLSTGRNAALVSLGTGGANEV